MIRAEHYQVRKPAVRSAGGVVAAQNAPAAEVGAEILRQGGNAMDAAVATALAVGTVEPWMSGIGGGGCMLVYRAADRSVHAIDFGMPSPAGLDPADYPLSQGGEDIDLFGWPLVVDQRNVRGYKSIGVPGALDGFRLGLETFGSMPFAALIEPSIDLARRGVPLTWWTMLRITGEAAGIARDPVASACYLPGGLPPVALDGPMKFLPLGNLAETYQRLAAAGPRDFYEGAVARDVIADLQAGGARFVAADLAGYRARLMPPITVGRGGAELHLVPGYTAGPTFADALSQVPDTVVPPAPAAFAAYARAMMAAYAKRFATHGHAGETHMPSSTTHLAVADRHGNMVTLTNTLLSVFGSKSMLPTTGILMNNAVMWFDPRPGGVNSLKGGVRPLTNMCPVVATRDRAPLFALGASGGRMIVSAVFQASLFMVDGGMDLEGALHHPRLSVSTPNAIGADYRLAPAVFDALTPLAPVTPIEMAAFPARFANPQGVAIEDGVPTGVAHPWNPMAAAAGA
ncbi:MAG: gamma-glutamyltransferase [Thalassobaculales bacterium]